MANDERIFMQLNKRQKDIIQLLLDHSAPLHGTRITERLGFSTRTLRQDILTINSFFKKAHTPIKSSPNKGYWIDDADKSVFFSYMDLEKDSLIPVSQNQREIAICFYLLEHDQEYVSMGLLADLLFVSKTTVFNTVKNIQTIIPASGNLVLSVSSQKGLLLTGSEESKRNFYASLLLLFYESEIEFINKYITTKYDPFGYRQSLSEILTDYFVKHHILMTTKSLMMIRNEILIAAFRIKTMNKSIDSCSYQGAPLLPFAPLEHLMDVSLSEDEKKYWNRLVKKKRTYSEKEDAFDIKPSDIIQEYYSTIQENFGLDLFSQGNLTEHIDAMLYYHPMITLSDRSALNHMKEMYPYAYKLASAMDPIIESHTGKGLAESELDALTARISVILDNNMRRFNVLIITNQSTSLTELLQTRLDLAFGNLISVIGVCPFYKVSASPTTYSVDFVLATSREKFPIDSDVIYINPVLNIEDIVKITTYLNEHLPSYCGY